MTAAAPILATLEARDGARRQQNGWWRATCPAHEDRNASFGWKLGETDDGRSTVILRCQAGCSNDAIVAALGASMADLFAPRNGAGKPRPRVIATRRYQLRDAAGEHVATHVRRELEDGTKEMPWELPDGRRGLAGRSVMSLPLYGAELLDGWDDGEPIVITEGEKAAEALRSVGIRAVATVTGAEHCPDAGVLADLAGRRVILWRDNDDIGRRHMEKVAERLGTIAAVGWIEPPPGRRKGWDAADAVLEELDVRALLAAATVPPSARKDEPTDPDPEDDDRLFLSPAEVYDGAPPVESVVPGIVAHGALTNLDGKPKAGKTTFVMALIAAGLHPDRRFLGYQVEFDVVIYLTEQGRDSFKEQLAGAGIGRDVVGRVEIVEWAGVHHLSWEDVLALVRRRIERKHNDARVLLVVDTFSKWARTKDENDATATMDAYRPLLLLTQELRTATIALRHGRKGDLADVTDSARGSNAASGEADIILHLGRAEGRPGEGRNVRRLRGVGRLGGIPDDLYIELRDGEYVALAEGEEYQAGQHRAAVTDAIERLGSPTINELVDQTGIIRSSVHRALAELTHPNVKRVTRSGSGRRGDPFRYAVAVENPDSEHGRTDAPDVSVQNPSPATDNEFSTPSHAQTGAADAAFATDAAFRRELVVGTPVHAHAQARDATASPRVECCLYEQHRSHHRRTPVGWVCDACAPAEVTA